MRDILKPGSTAAAQHHMKESSKTSSSRGAISSAGKRSTFATSSQGWDCYAANFITCYQDILVVNPKCI